MARQKGVDAKIQVTRGFVTEFTPIAFPQEAAIDIDNCVIDTDGSVRRRPGIDLEQQFIMNTINGAVLTDAEMDTYAFSTGLWESVGNSGTLNIVVQQVGTILQFFAQIGTVSKNLLGEVDLTPYAVDVAEVRINIVAAASGLGDLFVTGKFLNPIQVSYDGAAFTVTPTDIRIRDFDGLDDGLAIDERPDTLGRNHYYNLRNQGWTDENILVFAGKSTGTNICSATGNEGQLSSAFGKDFPSNVDIMSTGIVTNKDAELEFDPEFIREGFQGNTPAPKGHFIVSAFNVDYDEVLGCPGTGQKVFPTRPIAVAFHQGRVFYTTPVVRNQVTGVYYSQQLITKDKAGNCFQSADPTAEDVNDLVATDGGFLPTPGIGEIYKMQELANGVVVIASNGVWYITGAEQGSGVSATSIRMDKVSNFGALGAGSVVEAEGVLFYWGVEGIIQISIDTINGAQVANVTRDSIQTYYINISAEARATATGVYIPEQRKIFWGYRDAAAQESLTSRTFNKMLVLDLGIKGFYKYSIAESSQQQFPQIVGMTLVRPLAEGTSNEDMLWLDGTPVLDINSLPMTSEGAKDVGQLTQLKMATMAYSFADTGWKTTFSTFHSRSFVDWFDYSTDNLGLPMDSFVEFAEFNMGTPHTRGRPTYVHSYFSKASKNLDPGGYYELPPLFYVSQGLRVSQSIIEILNKPSSNLRVSQSFLEVLLKSPSDFRVSQSVVEAAALHPGLSNADADIITLDTTLWIEMTGTLPLVPDGQGVPESLIHDPAYSGSYFTAIYASMPDKYHYMIYWQNRWSGEYMRAKSTEQPDRTPIIPINQSEYDDAIDAWLAVGAL